MSNMPRADFWFSIILTTFGATALFESWRMPRLANLGIDPISAPGITPGLLALVLTGLGITLFIRSARQSIDDSAPGEPGSWGRLSIALGLCLFYALGLLGRIDFLIATAIFVFAFAFVFSDRSRSLMRRMVFAALLAVPTAYAVTFLFERIFLIRLP